MKIKIINIIFFLLLSSCKNNTQGFGETSKLSSNSWNNILIDTILVDNIGNNFVKYHLANDSTYTLEWGNKSFDNYSKNKFDLLGNGILKVLDSNNESILLNQSCGTSCTTYVVLPLKRNAIEKHYLFAKAYNLNNQLIAYVTESEDSLIRIENYETGKTMDIIENDLCPATFKGDCLDQVTINNNYITIKWQGSKWTNTSKDSREKIYKVFLQ